MCIFKSVWQKYSSRKWRNATAPGRLHLNLFKSKNSNPLPIKVKWLLKFPSCTKSRHRGLANKAMAVRGWNAHFIPILGPLCLRHLSTVFCRCPHIACLGRSQAWHKRKSTKVNVSSPSLSDFSWWLPRYSCWGLASFKLVYFLITKNLPRNHKVLRQDLALGAEGRVRNTIWNSSDTVLP